jgi:hypothetical protein
MQKHICDICGKTFALNDLASVFDKILCDICTKKQLDGIDQDQINTNTVYNMVDPTICARCGADNGQHQYELFMEMPICGSCREYMQNYPFPLWIKAACVGLIIIVIFSISWNLKFFHARILMDRSIKLAFKQEQWVQAYKDMQKASELVPESTELKTLSNYMAGIVGIQQEDYIKALHYLEKCRDMPEDFGVNILKTKAQLALAFDNKDYQKFLQLSQKLQKLTPDDQVSLAQVGSAYACLYALDAREEDRQRAMDYLKKAEALNKQKPNPLFEEYRERILHRIETRQILSRKEYYEKTGKTPPEEKQ